MSEILPILAALLLGGGALAWLSTSESGWERRVYLGSLIAHVLSAFAQVWITRNTYGGGDMFHYFTEGLMLASLLRANLANMAGEVGALILQQEHSLPFEIIGAGSSTGTMSGITGFLLFLFDDSLYASCICVAVFSWGGKVVLYQTLRASFPSGLHVRVAVASTLIPSVVFWSSAILKEPIAIAGLGWSFAAFVALMKRRKPVHLARFAAGCVVVALVKPYILFALAIALGAMFYWASAQGDGTAQIRVRPFVLVFGITIAFVAIAGLEQVFPQYAVASLGEQAARYQELGAMVGGGSYYEVGNAEARTLAGQLAFSPIALFSAWFRPLLFEVRNAQMAVNALETTALTILFVKTSWTRSWGWVWRTLRASPALIFCVCFCTTFGIAVGLATTNLGTLSRYRMPLVPFLATLVLTLSWSGWTAAKTPRERVL